MALRAAAVLLLATCVVLTAAQNEGDWEYRIVVDHDIVGNDMPDLAKKLPYTKVCVPAGGYKGKIGWDAFELICDETPKCAAFVTPSAPDGCAYLKLKGTRDVIKPDAKWVTVTSQEKPAAQCTFSPIGGPCTTDVWSESPVCCGGNHNKCVNGKCATTFPSPGTTPPNSPRAYRVVPGHHIVGNDISSADGKAPYTKFCGTYKGKMGNDGFKALCDDTPKCVAAVSESNGCAYLKTKGSRDVIKPDAKFTVLTSQEKPQKACTFSPNGGPCSTDVWVDQPICCGGNHVKCNKGVCSNTLPGRRMF